MKSIVLVEPEVPENTGFIARLASNFEYSLRIVQPEFNLSEARKTANKSQEKLRNAKIYPDFREAVSDLDYVVGTKEKRGSSIYRFEPRSNTSLAIGRESNGLKNQELEICDSVVHIPAGSYSSLNQSHAAAVLASYFYRSSSEGMSPGQKQKIEELAPPELADKIICSNPSKTEAGRIISELMDLKK